MADLLDALVDNLNGTGQAGDGLEVPEDLGGAGDAAGPTAAMAGGGAVLGAAQGLLKEDEGRAVGEVEGRRMGVMQPDSSGAESLGALASSAASIALLGLPGKAVTSAVGSKL